MVVCVRTCTKQRDGDGGVMGDMGSSRVLNFSPLSFIRSDALAGREGNFYVLVAWSRTR
jgi:hypothetical protein